MKCWTSTLLFSLVLLGCGPQENPGLSNGDSGADGRSHDVVAPVDGSLDVVSGDSISVPDAVEWMDVDAEDDGVSYGDAVVSLDVADSEDGVTWDVIDDAGSEDATPVEYLLDDVLRFNHLQSLGTHNSYHKKPAAAPFVPPWNYEHLPLDQQAGEQGVRQYELDVYFNGSTNEFDVYHIPAIDQETTCATLSECLSVLKGWSDENPDHTPLYVMVEWKDGFDEEAIDEQLAILDQSVLSIWPWERLIGPDWIQGDTESVRDGLAAYGWPTLSELRGRLMMILHDGGDVRDAYTEGGTTTQGKVFFPDAYGDTSLPFAAHHSMNGPVGGFDDIQSVVSQGHLVRTRADGDSEEALALDYTRFEAALASGAHFISTDYPFPGDEENYGVTIPGGTPSRCNPLTAPEECTSEAIEYSPVW